MNAILDRIKEEPAMFYALVSALITMAVAFGLNLSTDQMAAVLAPVAILLGLLTRSVVTPTAKLA
jgi:uncharacterized membrane protein